MKTDWGAFSKHVKRLNDVASAMQLVDQVSIKLNYAAVARRAGLQSRSFARMLFHGKKSASLETLKLVLESIKAPGLVRRFFIALWECENSKPGTILHKKHLEALEKIRTKVSQSSQVKPTEEAYISPDLPRIFAALGSVEAGATLEQIQKRTRLSQSRIEKALKKFIDLKLVTKKDEHYFPPASEMLLEQAKPDGFFQQVYLNSARDAMNRARVDFGSRENLFASFSVSVSSKKMKEHADQLYERLKDYLQEIEEPEGDTVISLNTSFHR